jgi:hypothetical protein
LFGGGGSAFGQPAAFPSEWILLQTDPNEGGTTNDHRDVQAVYYQVEQGYLFLRMETRAAAGWPGTGTSHPARFKWLFDLEGTPAAIVSGGQVRYAEFLLMVEDLSNSNDTDFAKNNRDHIGEITLMDDFVHNEENDGFRQWDATNPPHYTDNSPSEGVSPSPIWRRVLGTGTPGAGGLQSALGPEIGYRLDGNRVDMYVELAHLSDVPITEICPIWATDQQDTNLDQAPCCDRPETDSCIPIETVGTIEIVKDTLPDSAESFGFTGNPSPLGLFNLTGSPGTDRVTFADVPPGAYTVEETMVPSGWMFASIICDEDLVSDSTIDLMTRTATIELFPGETVTCEFVNVESSPQIGEATIVIAKDSIPDGPAVFGFSGTAPIGDFSLDDTGPTDQKSMAFTVDTGASYTIAEVNLPAGWDLYDIACTATSPSGSGVTATPDIDGRQVVVSSDLATGDFIACTFTNRQRGSITVRKEAFGEGPSSFDFQGPQGSFALGGGESQVIADLIPGMTYTVREIVPPGSLLTAIHCDGALVSIDLENATATIPLDPGAAVTCSFTNTEPASLTVRKAAVPPDPQDFEFASGFGGFFLDSPAPDDGDGVSDTITFLDLAPGVVNVGEIVPPDWQLLQIACTDPDGGTTVDVKAGRASIDIDAGEDIDCTFVNQRPSPAPAPTLSVAGLVAAIGIFLLLAFMSMARLQMPNGARRRN